MSKLKRSLLHSSEKEAAPKDVWLLCEEAALPMELLALEVKLSLPKTLSVGVVLVRPGDADEAAAMQNVLSKELEVFLALISTPVESHGWSGYAGGMHTKEEGTIYYASWKGFEIVFHVAPLLSAVQRRQYIGNDKVMVLFFEGLTSWPARFRGHVNSAALCVAPVGGDLYDMKAYHRAGMGDSQPLFPRHQLSFEAFREHFFVKLINAHTEAYSLLYAERMKAVWQEDLEKIVSLHQKGKKKHLRK